MKKIPSSRRWQAYLQIILLLLIIFSISSKQTSAQDLRPEFSESECPPHTNGYVVEEKNGHAVYPGVISCSYHKTQSGENPLDNWKSFYVSYYPSFDEVTAQFKSRWIDSDHLGQYSCDVHQDCDWHERVLVEVSDTAFYGYTVTLDRETNLPIHYYLERRFIEETFEVTIFVNGEIFTDLGDAMQQVDEFEAVAKEMIARPRNMVGLPTRETTSETEEPSETETPESTPTAQGVDEDKIGMACDEYCLSLEPIGFRLSGQTYPDCQCDCGSGNAFVGLKCTTCTQLCSGEGMRLVSNPGEPCTCFCTDPQQKYDAATNACIPLSGSECNRNNKCEPELGENCQACSDCGCTFGSTANSQYSINLTCDPAAANADIYGCVFEIPDKETQLNIMNEEWNQCRDAWLLMYSSGSLSDAGADGAGVFSDLQLVQTWQQKSGCIPQDGVVLGREAADPMVCLMRYCDRIKTGIKQMEQRIKYQAPVVTGPGIKVNPPKANVSVVPGPVVRFNGALSLYGDRPAQLITPYGNDFVHSKFEIVSDPEFGMKVYLYDGSYTHIYYDPQDKIAKLVTLNPLEMVTIGLDGVPVALAAFDPASREAWWEKVDYLVTCPENSTQSGADCFCDQGYETDIYLERCIPTEKESSMPLTIILIIAGVVVLIAACVIVFLVIRKGKHRS